jgi:RIO kinase 1
MLAVSSIFVLYMQAIDPRTRMVLFRMLNRGVFDNINGCISTGKEVNLQFAVHIALHVFY